MSEDAPEENQSPPEEKDSPSLLVSSLPENASHGDEPFPSTSPSQELSPEAEALLRRREKIQRLWQARFMEVARFVVFVGLFYGIYLWLTQPYWTLTPKRVQVEGNRMMQASRLKQGMKEVLGTHLLTMNPAKMAKVLEASDPLIARVQVRRVLLPKPHVLLRVSEHRPWGLVYNPWEKASVLAWHHQSSASQKVPPPYAFVLDSYKSLHFTKNQYQLPKEALADRFTFMFMDTDDYRRLNPNARQQRLEQLDRIIEGVRQIKGVDVESVTLSKRQHLQLDVTLDAHPVVVVAGELDVGIFKRLARLKPALKKIHELNEASPKNLIDRVDVSWNENLYLRRQQL
ncbi:MAG: FtsQ-type POTRA domain-containing protein [Vampirovibrionales bacterium]|nr:FtsQ-type POTRA domain-containing protein [Vampirovibrionales bacterium]